MKSQGNKVFKLGQSGDQKRKKEIKNLIQFQAKNNNKICRWIPQETDQKHDVTGICDNKTYQVVLEEGIIFMKGQFSLEYTFVKLFMYCKVQSRIIEPLLCRNCKSSSDSSKSSTITFTLYNMDINKNMKKIINKKKIVEKKCYC